MSFRGCLLLALALVVCACGSGVPSLGPGGLSAGASLGGGGVDGGGGASQTEREVESGGPNFITRAELEQYRGEGAYYTVDLIRRRWLRPQRSTSASFGPPIFARVIIDGNVRRELGDLRSMSVDAIENMRYLSAADATTRYGTGYLGGVIEVTTRGR